MLHDTDGPILVAVMPDNRNGQLVRILNIVRDLDRQDGADLYELAERHGTTVRTIRRDLAALAEAGLPIVEEGTDGAKKKWRMGFRDKLDQVASLLDLSHYLALRLAMDGGTHGKTSSFTALEDLAQKIEGSLGKGERARLKDIMRAVFSWEKFTYEGAPPDVLWPLLAAIADKKVCKVRYRAASHDEGEKTYRLLPLKLFAYDRALYLHAHVLKHDAVVVLNLQRLVELAVLDEVGKVPAGYDAEALAGSAFGVFIGKKTQTYALRFAPAMARRISERTWHPSQKLRDRSDGSVDLELTCFASPEIVSWIRSFGTDVEVLAPDLLRRELATLGRALAARYA